jgi:16S rRNA G966 N2-methylase RsmD
VVAVDSHPGCVRFIRKTADALQLPVTTHKRDVLKYLKQCSERFDLIFADPPYDISETALKELASLCLERSLLKKGGILVIEHSEKKDLSGQQGFFEARSYGSTLFSFFREAE